MAAFLQWLGTHVALKDTQHKCLAKSFLVRKKAQASKNVGTCHITLRIVALCQDQVKGFTS